MDSVWKVSLAILGAGAIVLGCGGGSDLTLPNEGLPAKIVIVHGDAQTGTVGSPVGDSLAVRVTDSKNRPVQGQQVGFAANAGTVVPNAPMTNADGRAAAMWMLGPAAGPQTVTATATGNGAPPGLAVTFHATATSSVAAKLDKTAGDGQRATAGSPVATPPAVKVTDASGNPVAGVPVTFAVTAGGGSVNPTTPVTTDATGAAAATSWTLGAVAGPNTLTATIPGTGITGNPTTFAATGTVGNAGKLAVARQPSAIAQSGVPFAQQPQVQLEDLQGNPTKTAGLAVTVTVASGVGAQLSGQLTVPTDPQGVASFTNLALTGPAGNYLLAFSNPTLAGVASATIVLGPGVATQLVIVQQPPTSAQSGVLLNPVPVVQVRDAQGNAVAQAGIAVTASLSGAGGSLGGTKTVATDGTGSAVFANLVISGLASAYTITFSASPLTSATSNAIAVGAGTPAQLAFTQQPSSVAAGTAISPPVRVSIEDGSGNVVMTATNPVTIALANNPGGSVLSGTLTISAVAGVASFSDLSLNKAGNGYTLAATSGALAQAVSTSFNIGAGAATQIAANSAVSQTATAGTAVPAPPSVIVRDANGNPVPGVAVTFAVASGGGGISPTSPTATNGSGIAILASWTLGGVAGTNTVTATIPGTGITGNPVTFTATGTVGSAAKLAKTAGDGQTATAGSPVATPPAVKVTDAGENPVAGVAVTFAVAAGGGSVNPTTPVNTNALGIATATSWTLGPVAGANALTATIPGGGITGNPATFTAMGTVGSAAKLAIVRQPSATAQSGVPFPQQPQVQLQDPQGNPVKTAGLAVTVTLASGVGAGLSGQLTQPTDANGLATFVGLTLGGVVGTYTLGFSGANLSGVTSAPIALAAGVPAKLVVVTPPSASVPNGQVFPQQPVIQVVDGAGNPAGAPGMTVRVAITAGGGTLGGTPTAATSASGVATFTGLSITGTVGVRQLTFSSTSPSLTPATASVIVTAGPPTQITANSATSQSASAGTAVAAPPSVIVRDVSLNPVLGTAVTFAVTAGGGVVSPATPVATNASGVASLTSWTLGPTPGANQVTATVTGLAGSPVVFNATGVATLAINTTSPLPPGEVNIAYADTLTASSGTAPYTWSVATGTLPSGLALNSNTGVISGTPTAPISSATFAIKVTDAIAATTTKQFQLTVLAPTATQLSSSVNPALRGQTVAFTAQVASAFGTVGSGTVVFIDGGSCSSPSTTLVSRSVNSSGVATFSKKDLTVGTHSILACYQGTATFAASGSAPLSQQITSPK